MFQIEVKKEDQTHPVLLGASRSYTPRLSTLYVTIFLFIRKDFK